MEEKKTPYAPDNLIGRPLEHYLALFREADCTEIAERTGIPCVDGRFSLRVLGEEKQITWPDFADEGWKDKERILFLRFLLEGKKPRPVSGFVTYRELPWGEVYDRQFHNRCIFRLAGTYGTRAAVFAAQCEALGGVRLSGSGTGYEFAFLPGLSVRMVLWEGDEDFPASAQILFSDNFPDAFSSEDCVIICETILGRLPRAQKKEA